MRTAPKKYNTLYKKNYVERDMYLPLLDPKGLIQCSGVALSIIGATGP